MRGKSIVGKSIVEITDDGNYSDEKLLQAEAVNDYLGFMAMAAVGNYQSPDTHVVEVEAVRDLVHVLLIRLRRKGLLAEGISTVGDAIVRDRELDG